MKDEPRQPLNVFAVDVRMDRATGSIPYRSLRWVRRFDKPGEFEMVVPANVFDPSWRYIACDDRPETGIVQKVEFTDDAQAYDGIDSVTVSGFFLESILNNVTFLQESPEQEKVYVPKPKRPVYTRDAIPSLYVDVDGNRYYGGTGTRIINAVTGAASSTDDFAEGALTTLSVESGYLDDHGQGGMKYSYKDPADPGKVTLVDEDGATETHEVSMEDGHGNLYWDVQEAAATVAVAVAVTTKALESATGYAASLRRWQALPDDDPYGRYELKDVKGPWQRTEMMEPVTVGDSVEIVMKWAQRMMGNSVVYVEPDFEGVQKAVDPSFQRLGDLLYSTLGEVGASLRMEYVFESNMYVLSCYKGTDRTQAQTSMPWAVFSDTWGTLSGYSAMRDESNYANTCYVLYEYDKPNAFAASGWPQASTYRSLDQSSGELPALYGIQYTRMRGYNVETVGDDTEPAIETYLDLRDEKPSCDGDWSREVIELDTSSQSAWEESLAQAQSRLGPPSDGSVDLQSIYEAYEEALPGRGVEHLQKNYCVITSLDTGIVKTNGYLRDFDLGDLVEMAVSTVGLATQARIIEVEESYTSGNVEIRLGIGDERLTMIQKARLA